MKDQRETFDENLDDAMLKERIMRESQQLAFDLDTFVLSQAKSLRRLSWFFGTLMPLICFAIFITSDTSAGFDTILLVAAILWSLWSCYNAIKHSNRTIRAIETNKRAGKFPYLPYTQSQDKVSPPSREA